ncbi:hypothetical protein C0Q70_16550 [Pomacea canaliculata]|uniref:Uncharacterized protein n=1 Tax=Pomacea canaliculata TaxID=400727 RepID=A0A2T7NQ35_POMCA|nr:hypothetical protein C0Q70_16550 [Pomacea canaliculata]
MSCGLGGVAHFLSFWFSELSRHSTHSILGQQLAQLGITGDGITKPFYVLRVYFMSHHNCVCQRCRMTKVMTVDSPEQSEGFVTCPPVHVHSISTQSAVSVIVRVSYVSHSLLCRAHCLDRTKSQTPDLQTSHPITERQPGDTHG